MTNLRDEIDRRLASNQVYYAHFVTEHDFPKIRKETTDDIISMIEKKIDEIKFFNFDPSWEKGFSAALSIVKEMLKS